MKIGVLFDLDGTLLDSLDDLTDAVNHTLRLFGCPEHTREHVRCAIGNGARQLIRLSVPQDKDEPFVDEVLKAYQKYYADNCRIKTRPYDGVLEALAQLQEKYPVAIVSNKPDVAVKPLCADYFPGVYAMGEMPDCKRKPAPDMVLKAMAQLGVDSCIYVGDSDVDVVTANNAGVPCLSVLWGFRDRSCIEAAGGKYFCEDSTRLGATLLEMLEKKDLF